MAQTGRYIASILDGLKKVFPDELPKAADVPFTALRGETFSFMTAYSYEGRLCPYARVRVESPLASYCHIRQVRYVPSLRPVNEVTDSGYLRTQPGLYPDLLTELDGGLVQFLGGQYQSLWIDVDIPADGPCGEFPVEVVFTEEEREVCRVRTVIKVYKTVLKPQTFLHTEWFHGDCLADYYQVKVFSEAHWSMMENFIRTAVKRGCNMILTPQFTPPLDTAYGGQRTTIQLVEVMVSHDGSYEFGFERMERFVKMCLRCGMAWFEMSHLFSQWGGEHPPKIMGWKEGEEQQLFGWKDPAAGGAYTEFLKAYLPKLTDKLREWGIAGCTRFHISDEPEPQHLLSYGAARKSVEAYLDGFMIMDAISSLDLAREGQIMCPVCSNDHIAPFLEDRVTPLWAYYCTAQTHLVSNRFMSMPSVRSRVFGMQAFQYGLEGILHWGYNFYNSQYSVRHLDPYRSTDADGAFPSGDPFLVYPGADGCPEESVRIMVLCHMMQDIRAMEQLADRIGREAVIGMINAGLDEPVTFERYPMEDEWLLKVRNRVNEELG